MSTSLSQVLRCPRCDAHVRAGSDWCTLCYADLRPAPPEPVPPVAEAPAAADDQGPGDGAPESLEAVAVPAAPVRRGKHARRDPDETSVDTDGTAQLLLAQLAVSESGDPLDRWSDLLDSPGKKLALMAGGAVVAMTLLFGLMSVLGSLL